MKTYVRRNDSIIADTAESLISVPIDPANGDYAKIMREIDAGEAVIVDYVPPIVVVEWSHIRYERDNLLKDCDWRFVSDTPTDPKWVEYRKALRDIPQTFDKPDDVVWPLSPDEQPLSEESI